MSVTLHAALTGWRRGEDAWLFAYGSLIWNPESLPIAEKRTAVVHGFHRSMCLWSRINRGTPAKPGLVLALDYGGSASGVLYRLRADDVEKSLRALWNREMATGAYRPRWLKCRSDNDEVSALGFVINHDSPSYAGRLSLARQAQVIASTTGKYGRCCDYLFNTVEALAAHGLVDHQLNRLAQLVETEFRLKT